MAVPERVPISARFGRGTPEQTDMVFVSQADIEAARQLEALESANREPMVIRREEVVTIDPRFLSQMSGSGMSELQGYLPGVSGFDTVPATINRYLGRRDSVSDMTELHDYEMVDGAPHSYRPGGEVVYVGSSPEQLSTEVDSYDHEDSVDDLFSNFGSKRRGMDRQKPEKSGLRSRKIILGAVGLAIVLGIKDWSAAIETGQEGGSFFSAVHISEVFNRVVGGDE